jgi:hypothetical protein
MLTYLDSANLIDRCQGSACIDISDFGKWLASRSHLVVFSLQTLIELSDRLRNGRLLEVRKDLNRLEDQLPHTFVNEGRISNLELREAAGVFEQGREYRYEAITPFADRLDRALDLFGEPQHIVEGRMRIRTEMIVSYPMAECILQLWRSDQNIFNVQRRREREWHQIMKADRSLVALPSLEDNFVKKIRGDLPLHRLRFPPDRVETFARWVYESPDRCPGIRLQYEAQHRFRGDKMTKTSASDMIDLTRIPAVPYVDFFITDKRMMIYCRQAAKVIDRPYPQLVGDLSDVIAQLS